MLHGCHVCNKYVNTTTQTVTPTGPPLALSVRGYAEEVAEIQTQHNYMLETNCYVDE